MVEKSATSGRTAGLSKEVKGADAQLKDLRRTVEYVDNNRESFTHIDHLACLKRLKHIRNMLNAKSNERHMGTLHAIISCTDAELLERKAFLSDSKQVLLEARDSLDGRQAREKLARDEQSELSKYRSKDTLAARTELERDNTEHILDQQARVRMNLARQDHDLEELGTHVDRVGETAIIINEELRSQNRMLTALDDDLDEAAEQMNFVMSRLGKLLKTKSKCKIWAILILSFILIILVFLLIYV